DADGTFSLSFGKKAFSQFNLEAEPDIFLKIYYFTDGRFSEIGKVTPEVFEKTTTREKKMILDLGTVEV
ncbi:MAG: hypothetical protein GY765_26450, partial [bacterium]|nr:hypothetical protein [bacterium]